MLIRISESRAFQEVNAVLKESQVSARCCAGGKVGDDRKDSKAMRRSLDLVIRAWRIN